MLHPRAESATHHNRLQFLDAARGSAMFFVLLSHFGFTFFPNQADPVPTAMRFAGMVASPTFMMLSGLILGFLYRTSPGSFERLRIKLADRRAVPFDRRPSRSSCVAPALHVAVLPHHGHHRRVHARAAVGSFEDSPAGPIGSERRSLRGQLGDCRTLAARWALPALVKETLFGSLTDQNYYRFAFPVVPWFSLDLASTSLGTTWRVLPSRWSQSRTLPPSP